MAAGFVARPFCPTFFPPLLFFRLLGHFHRAQIAHTFFRAADLDPWRASFLCPYAGFKRSPRVLSCWPLFFFRLAPFFPVFPHSGALNRWSDVPPGLLLTWFFGLFLGIFQLCVQVFFLSFGSVPFVLSHFFLPGVKLPWTPCSTNITFLVPPNPWEFSSFLLDARASFLEVRPGGLCRFFARFFFPMLFFFSLRERPRLFLAAAEILFVAPWRLSYSFSEFRLISFSHGRFRSRSPGVFFDRQPSPLA